MNSVSLPGPVAVVDLETTGLFPFRHDRIVELAVVVLGREGRVEREFVSLVNPGRDIGPRSIHGLSSADILHAPSFGEIAGHLVDVLDGTMAFAAHNMHFDRLFLDREFAGLNYLFPLCECLCTMQLAAGGRLQDCCDAFGVELDGEAHDALADARAAAKLLVAILSDDPAALGDVRWTVPIAWPRIPRSSCRPVTRTESRFRQAEPLSYLQRLVSRIEGVTSGATDAAIMAYVALLDRVIEDRRIDETEAEALLENATQWGLSGEDVRLAHRDYMRQLAQTAVADGVVTETERRDLNLVARLLGQGSADLDVLLNQAAANKPAIRNQEPHGNLGTEGLKGNSVCFTGELSCSFGGQPLSREEAEKLAAGAGLKVLSGVTKKLDILVVADPDTQSGKAKKARQYGTRIMHEPVFWKAAGVEVQ